LFPAVRLSEGKYYSYDISEDELRRIYLVDYLNKSLELVYETTAYKISSFDTDDASGRITSVNLLKEGQLQTDYIDESGESYLLGSESGLNVVLAKNNDETVSLTYSESINNSGVYSVITESGPSEVGRVMPSLAGVKPVRLVKETLKQDDIEFEYLLTIPDALNNPAPLIVMPHGGPIGVFDDQFFDRQSRFLNDSGYAVLRVNYRGSGGYSKALLEAGKGEFGKGMLTDIHTATLHASQREDIDRSKICLAGFSYGGYASTMLAIKHPNSYKCAVTVAGVADWYLSLTSTRLSQYQYQWVKEYVGDISTDVEQIQRVSPIHHVKDLQVPIMIMHGKEDKVVDVEHAFRLRYKLEQANKPYEWHVFEKSGHHFRNDDDLNIVFDKMINFIATQMEN
jgi:dipeptidyl aminopeptidase/acylaminoacyl peptidase